MKKIIYAVPPIKNPKGYATVGQNRQFQWFKDPTFIYPIIPALAMTMLMKANNQVLWVDAVSEELNEVEFGKLLIESNPSHIIFEAPTPLIDVYKEIINGIKNNLPDIKIILTGEHISAVDTPEIKADHFVKGGKWYREVYKIVQGKEWEGPLPHINRPMSRWWLYGYKNGNFKYIPATYIMSAMDCWYGRCRFCAWSEYHKDCFIRPVDDVIAEIGDLIQSGFKEIFDDSGTFPVGDWLEEFCRKVIEKEYNKHVAFGCNMRFGALKKDAHFALLAQAGFRMVLWGLESVNQETLNMLNKGVDIMDMNSDLIKASAAGLDNHLTVMFGYPWETYEDAKRTRDMVRTWLLNGVAFSAQATICIPYPITPLWKTCKQEGLLTTEKWSEYDMSKPVMKIPYSDEKLFALQKSIYNVAFHPKFIYQKLKKIRNFEDFKYYMRIGKKIYDRFGNFFEVGKA